MPSLKIKDATIAYTDAGHGDTVLLLHGSASSRRMWQPLVEQLAARYRVVAPDLVGYGESTPWRDGLQATDYDLVATFAHELGSPLHVIGHSYGGALALRAALARGSRVTSLALVEPAAFLMLDAIADRAALGEIEAVASRHLELVAAGDLDACAAHFMGYWIGVGDLDRDGAGDARAADRDDAEDRVRVPPALPRPRAVRRAPRARAHPARARRTHHARRPRGRPTASPRRCRTSISSRSRTPATCCR